MAQADNQRDLRIATPGSEEVGIDAPKGGIGGTRLTVSSEKWSDPGT